VFSDRQLPTLWDPLTLFFHLAIRAGAPVIMITAATTLLGIYQSVKSWIEFGDSTIHAVGVAGGKLRSWTTRQQRAMVRLLVFSALTVAASYMLAVLVDFEIRTLLANPNAVISMTDVVDHVGVTPWPLAAVWTVVGELLGITVLGVAYIADLRGLATFVTALGSVVWIAASIGGFMLALDAIGGFMMELFSSDGSAPPFRFVVTIAGTGLLGLVLARWLPKVGEASADAFAPSERI
jgi:hypothetical protein